MIVYLYLTHLKTKRRAIIKLLLSHIYLAFSFSVSSSGDEITLLTTWSIYYTNRTYKASDQTNLKTVIKKRAPLFYNLFGFSACT